MAGYRWKLCLLRRIYLFLLTAGLVAAYERTCKLPKFSDSASLAYSHDIVFEGPVKSIRRTKVFSNTTFTVRKLFKGNLPKKADRKYRHVTVGENRPDSCPDLQKKNRYFVFMRTADKESSVIIIPYKKEHNHKIKRIICNDCAKNPTVQLKVDGKQEYGNKIVLKCIVKGTPQPNITWFFRNKIIIREPGVKIRKISKGSRLRIRNANSDHTGYYKCRAENVVGTVEKEVSILVQENPVSYTHSNTTVGESRITHSPHVKYVLCKPEMKNFCYNNGDCLYSASLGERFCRCHKDFVGRQCQLLKIPGIDETRMQGDMQYDRTVTMAGIIIGVCLLAIMFVAAYCMARKRRKEFYRKRQRKLAKQAPSSNGTYKQLSAMEAQVPSHADLNPGFNTQASNDSKDFGTQTDEYNPLQYMRETIIDGPGEKPNMTDPMHPPRPNVNIPRSSSGSLQRDRLMAVTATPDIDFTNPRYPGNSATVVSAVIESDPEPSRHSSPSQSSKTESAHGTGEQLSGTADTGGKGESETGSRDISLDVEAHSDYDNNDSDLEGETHGLEMSDDLVQGGTNSYPDDLSSDTSASDTDSDGLEREHFKQLQSKRMVNGPHSHDRIHNLEWGPPSYANVVPDYKIPSDPYRNSYADHMGHKMPNRIPHNYRGPALPTEKQRLVNS